MNQIEVALKFAALHVLVSFALFTVALLLLLIAGFVLVYTEV